MDLNIYNKVSEYIKKDMNEINLQDLKKDIQQLIHGDLSDKIGDRRKKVNWVRIAKSFMEEHPFCEINENDVQLVKNIESGGQYGTISHVKYKNNTDMIRKTNISLKSTDNEHIYTFIREVIAGYITRKCPFFVNIVGVDWKNFSIFFELCQGDLEGIHSIITMTSLERISIVKRVITAVKYLHC